MQTTKSIAPYNASGIIVDVECHITNGLPAIIIVGLGGKAVDEAKERIRSAFASSGIPFPKKRITINLAPADIPKDSTGLDLAIATSILKAANDSAIPHTFCDTDAIIGELGLDGSIRPVRGIIGKLIAGRDKGIKTFYIPKANIPQASVVPGVRLIALETFSAYAKGLSQCQPFGPHNTSMSRPLIKAARHSGHTLSQISGQERAKRALEIAAAGGHNIFISGAPGTGKSMLAKALPGLLPAMSMEEILEVTHLHSLANNDYETLVTARPFRSPHHSASQASLVGGGSRLRPGEISLSHRGVLFLDEMPEFSRHAIESLRQPLEDGTVTINRAREVAVFPASFILVATANPCPCGYYGSDKECGCPAYAIRQYRQKISGPVMDRFDMRIESEPVRHTELLQADDAKSTEVQLKERVTQARSLQKARYGSPTLLNSELTNKAIRLYCNLEPAATTLLNTAASRLRISARSYMRLIKVARTIADLDASQTITASHMSEALQYRSQNQATLP